MSDTISGRCPSDEQLDSFLAGTADPAERTALEAHLQQCEPCRQQLEQLRAELELLQGLGRVLRQKQQADQQARSDTPEGVATGSSPSGTALPTERIEGYRILEEIGRGGMGVVYKAIQLSTKRTVALKVLLAGPFASETARRRFEREVELAASLDHPNIVTIHDSGLHHGRHYLVMSYIEGQRLDSYVADKQPDLCARLALVQTVCRAVDYAHRHGIVHRDLKPGNILVDAHGEPHILDFGLARNIETDPGDSLLSISGQILGTLPYMAPEQVSGSRSDIDARTDIYALGVICYELLTSRYPYPVIGHMAEVFTNIMHAKPLRPRTYRKDISSDLERVVLKALAKSRAERYESAKDFASALDSCLAGQSSIATKMSDTPPARTHALSARTWLLFGLAAATVALAGAGIYPRLARQPILPPNLAAPLSDAASVGRTQSWTWSPGTHMLVPRNRPAATLGLDGHLYVMGGGYLPQGGTSGSTETVERLDELTGQWAHAAPMLKRRWGPGAVTDSSGRIWVTGGIAPNGVPYDDVELYDPRTDTWTAMACRLNTRRYAHGTAIDANNRIYVIGGESLIGGVVEGVLSSVEKYDPATGTWSYVAPMNTPRTTQGTAVDTLGRIYAIGGSSNVGGGQFCSVGSAERYRPATNTWEFIASLPGGLALEPSLAFEKNGEIWIVGGVDFGNGWRSDCYIYTPDSCPDPLPPGASRGAWRMGPSLFRTSVRAAGAVAKSGNVYLVGGEQQSPLGPVSDVAVLISTDATPPVLHGMPVNGG